MGTLPFGREEFLDIIAAYNVGVAPLQLALLAVAAAALALPLVHAPRAGRWVAVALSLLWLWMGVVFHVAFFSRVSRGGRVGGAGRPLDAGGAGRAAGGRLTARLAPPHASQAPAIAASGGASSGCVRRFQSR